MRKILSLIFMWTFLVLCFSCSGDNNGEDFSDNPIVGDWRWLSLNYFDCETGDLVDTRFAADISGFIFRANGDFITTRNNAPIEGIGEWSFLGGENYSILYSTGDFYEIIVRFEGSNMKFDIKEEACLNSAERSTYLLYEKLN